MAVLIVAALGAGCGDDGGNDGDNDNESGRGGGGSGEAGRGGMIEGEGVACGSTRCTMPEGSTAEPCCADMFESVCGMRGGFGGTACVAIVPVDPRCPTVSLGPLGMLPSCCTADNMCGINGEMFGEAECIELSQAEQEAMDRAMMFGGDEDGGMPGGGLPGGFTIDFPDPQACE
jgi:hypothetical protein